jgi:GxxExxY protein
MEPQTTPTTQNHDERTYAIIGAALEVQHTLGCGFLERVYNLALARELHLRGIPFEREVVLPISSKGEVLDCNYRVDFLCFGDVIVELKAQRDMTKIDDAQLMNYLHAAGLRTGLLLNFGNPGLEKRRFSVGW